MSDDSMSRVDWSVGGNVEAMWEGVAREVKRLCSKVLGVSKGGRQ